MADFETPQNNYKTKDTASAAFEKLDKAGGVDAVENALKEQYTPALKHFGNEAGEWGKGVFNKIFHGGNKNSTEVKTVETTSGNPVKTPPPIPSGGLPNAKESMVLSDSADPKLKVSTPIPMSIQPEADSSWGKVRANVSGTTVKGSIDKGNNRYSIFGDPMSKKVGAGWQNGCDGVQLSHNLSSHKTELGYDMRITDASFNASVWQQGSSYGAATSYKQKIDSHSQFGVNAAVSKTSGEGVKAAASLMYTNKGPRQNVSLGATASYEKGQSYVGVSGRLTF